LINKGNGHNGSPTANDENKVSSFTLLDRFFNLLCWIFISDLIGGTISPPFNKEKL
jgi:hypothetical protein